MPRLSHYEPNPSVRWMPCADTPVFCEVTNHTAANHDVNGVRVRWKIVPAVTDVFRPQSVHIHNCFFVRQKPPQPQPGHSNPRGQRNSARYSLQAKSSGNHSRNCT